MHVCVKIHLNHHYYNKYVNFEHFVYCGLREKYKYFFLDVFILQDQTVDFPDLCALYAVTGDSPNPFHK
jgi:hypothetical protein